MANPSEWGPLLWKIIHITCENLGRNTYNLLQIDELNAFQNFINKTGTVLPCVVCRKHYNAYYLKNKKKIVYNELKTYGKRYFYGLHEEVNNDNKVKGIEFIDLEKIYGHIEREELNILIKEFEKLFQKYILYHYIHPNAVKDFLATLRMLRSSMS